MNLKQRRLGKGILNERSTRQAIKQQNKKELLRRQKYKLFDKGLAKN